MSDLEWKPATASELSRLVRENFDGTRSPLLPVGGRTALHFGGPVQGEVRYVLTEELNRIIDYPARDMTFTVEAGMRIDTLREHLATEHQQLPIDIPQSHRATLGGAIAANVSGPSRFGYGTFRDYVLGISAVDGQGRLFSAGGRVVKNVAGYDLCKLMIGSLGTLGIITQVTLKLTPIPEDKAFVIVHSQQPSQIEAVLTKLNLSATRPVILDLLNAKAVRQLAVEPRQILPGDPYLICIGYAGTKAETDWQINQVISELQDCQVMPPVSVRDDQAAGLWKELTEYQSASDDPLTFRASILPSQMASFVAECSQSHIAVQAHAGNGIVIGHLSDENAEVERAGNLLQSLRTRARESGGSVVILNCEDNWNAQLNVFDTPLPAERLMRELKATFDPAGLLSPGRIW